MTGEKKKLNIVGGLTDLLLFVMFVGGAGFAGYFIGINQKLAPVQMVPPGTVEAIEYIAERAAGLRGGGHAPGQAQPPGAAPPRPLPTNPSTLPVKKDEPAEKSKVGSESTPVAKEPPASQEPKVSDESKTTVSVTDKTATEKSKEAKLAKKKKVEDAKSGKSAKDAKASKDSKAANEAKDSKKAALKKRYWVASSGSDYIGSSVTVVVNGQPVDNFFGPGKLVDVSRFVKKGANQITFDSKVLDDEYNQHLGNSKFDLILKLVSGGAVREDFDSSAVLLTFKRTAADVEDGSNTLDFTAKE